MRRTMRWNTLQRRWLETCFEIGLNPAKGARIQADFWS
jgi:hypothetical protein